MRTAGFVKFIGVFSTIIVLVACQTEPPHQPPRPHLQPHPRPYPHTHPSQPPHPPSLPASAPISLADTIDGSDTSKYSIAVERIFAEGLGLYDNGKYTEAIKKLRSPEITKAWPELRIRALKYLAFSYCVTNKLQECQQAFYDAMKIDPEFKLQSSEKNHPIWGAAFKKAQSSFSRQQLPIQENDIKHPAR